jgi:hypothetical protein
MDPKRILQSSQEVQMGAQNNHNNNQWLEMKPVLEEPCLDLEVPETVQGHPAQADHPVPAELILVLGVRRTLKKEVEVVAKKRRLLLPLVVAVPLKLALLNRARGESPFYQAFRVPFAR